MLLEKERPSMQPVVLNNSLTSYKTLCKDAFQLAQRYTASRSVRFDILKPPYKNLRVLSLSILLLIYRRDVFKTLRPLTGKTSLHCVYFTYFCPAFFTDFLQYFAFSERTLCPICIFVLTFFWVLLTWNFIIFVSHLEAIHWPTICVDLLMLGIDIKTLSA